jgi:hypothetical protein
MQRIMLREHTEMIASCCPSGLEFLVWDSTVFLVVVIWSQHKLLLLYETSVFRCCCFASTAEHGDLTFMIGGHPRATDAVTPLLKQMGKDVIYCGKHGAGTTLALCTCWLVSMSCSCFHS